MQQIENLLRQAIGLDAASVGSPAIERAVRQRLQQLGLKTAQYGRLLETSPGELDQLVEGVVVTETWFFRDHHPFSACQQAAQEWLARQPPRPLRILSVPCSSGEEPYSIAIALLDAAVKPDRFEIHAVDISMHALAQAKQGVYGQNSFRGLPPRGETFRDRHFRLTQGGYELNGNVRDRVKFHRDNLVAETFHVGHRPYDIIFCRNLLIYFDRATQQQAVAKLDALLTPGGLLFVGPAELPLVALHGFANARLPKAFACRKPVTAHETAGENAAGKKAETLKLDSSISAVSQDFSVSAFPPIPALAAARRLADAGHLEEAANVCQAHLRDCGPSATAYYLLGRVHEAKAEQQTEQGDEQKNVETLKTQKLKPDSSISAFQHFSISPPEAFQEAIACYRKALYLQPDHYETLRQISQLLEKTGDPAGARQFRRRAQRAQPKH